MVERSVNLTTGNFSVSAVRTGLPYEAFTALRDSLFITNEQLASVLGIARRTLSKRRHDGHFTASESNAISRVSRLYVGAVNFFGNPDHALTWLKTLQPALEATPLSLLDTDPGAEEVSALLRKLSWGIYP